MKKTLFFLCLFIFLIHPSQKIKDVTSMVNPIGNVLVGYWHNWGAIKGSGYQKGTPSALELKDVPIEYNVINVSFMKVFDSSTGRIPTFILDPSTGMNEDTFKSQIKQINQQGRAVLIALGGAEASGVVFIEVLEHT